jgi:hypothetical protein
MFGNPCQPLFDRFPTSLGHGRDNIPILRMVSVQRLHERNGSHRFAERNGMNPDNWSVWFGWLVSFISFKKTKQTKQTRPTKRTFSPPQPLRQSPPTARFRQQYAHDDWSNEDEQAVIEESPHGKAVDRQSSCVNRGITRTARP